MRLSVLISTSLLLLGCQETIGGAVPPAPPAVASQPAEPAVRVPATAPVVAADPELKAQVEDLELEVAQLKLVIEQMQQAGIGSMDAEHVGYQPNRTTLAARDVQAALDELWGEVHGAQEAAVDMGAPGEGLFDLENGPLGPRRSAEDKNHQPQGGQPMPPPGGMQPPPAGEQGMRPPAGG